MPQLPVSSHSILIVEDEEGIAFLLKKRLRDAGYKDVEYAPDGIQAVRLARKLRPDLILLDILVPGGDGLSVLKKIKMSMHTEKTSVIVITGMQNAPMKEKILAEGVQAYIQKPYKSEEVLEAIKKVFGAKDAQGA